MTTRAVAATNENVANTDTYVSVALGMETQINLPKINDGTGATVAVGTHIRVQNTAGGLVDVRTSTGRHVGTVQKRSSSVFVAGAGTVQNEPDDWYQLQTPSAPAAYVAGSAAYVQAELQAIRAALVANGLMKAE